VEQNSNRAIYAALIANIAIAITKFTVAAITGSAAMWSEGIHSTVDTGNEILILIGHRKSRRPPDARHPFGHGKEVYFWNLLVAVLIFGAGGGVSVYEGILHVIDPTPIQNPGWNYLVLGSAAVFEGISLTIALRQFFAEHGNGNLLQSIVESKNPSVFTVVTEDIAAICGVVIAASGIFLSITLRMQELDGVASILIGLLLAGVATFLIRECRGLLVGEGVNRPTEREIVQLARQNDLVEAVARPLTMYIGPDNVLLILDVQFRKAASASEVAEAIEEMKERLRQRFSDFHRIYIEAAESVKGPQGPLTLEKETHSRSQ
jgi:cation diffusion facilitator family transporter